ncbi:hypothetical protein DEI81_03335 [Curtobacterium sp. MCBD17_013]|nr:hypothetical protein DEI81_03335 [Curtobacterium sp. MCBD17_013]
MGFDPALGKVTFREPAEAVLEPGAGDLWASTLVSYRQGLKSLVCQTFANERLSAITVEDVDRWWSKHQDAAPATKNTYMTRLLLGNVTVVVTPRGRRWSS